MGRLGRFGRGVARFFVWLIPGTALAAVAVTGLAWLWLRTEAGNDWLLGQVLPLLQPTAGRIEVGRLRTDVWDRVAVEDLVVRDPEGVALIRVGRLDADVALQSLVGRVAPVRSLRVEGLDVQLDDPAVFGRMWPSDPTVPSAPWAGLPIDVLVEELALSGRLSVSGQTLEAVQLSASVTARKKQVSWTRLVLRATAAGGPVELVGAGAWSPERTVLEPTTLLLRAVEGGGENRVLLHGALADDRLAIDLDALHLDFPALTGFVPAVASVPVTTPLDITGKVSGTLHEPVVALDVQSAGGPLVVSASVVPTERTWSLKVQSTGFDTLPVMPSLEPLRFAGELDATGHGWTWPDDLSLDGTLDAALTLRGEALSARGPVHLDHGVLRLDHLDAGGYGADASLSGEVDLVGRRATLTVHRANGTLARFKAGGAARFAGEVEVGWGERTSVAVAGKLAAANLNYRGFSTANLDADVKVGWDGRAASGAATFDATSLQYGDRRAATAHGTVELGDSATFALRLANPDAEVAFAEGAFRLEDRLLRLDALRAEVAPGLGLAAEGVQTVRILDDGLADADLHLRLGEARLGATGGINKRTHDTLVVAIEGLDLHDVDTALPGKLPGWQGIVHTHLGLVGTLTAPHWEGDLRLAGFVLPGQVDGLSANLAFEGDGSRAALTGEVGGATAEHLSITATLPVQLGAEGVRWEESGAVEARVVLAPTDTAPLAELLAGRKLPEARLSAELRLSGSLLAPVLGLTASADLPLATDGPTARVWLEGGLTDGVAKARVVLNQSFQSRMEANLGVRVDTPRVVRRLTHGEALPEVDALLSGLGGAIVLKQLPIATIRRVVPFEGDVDGALAGAFVVSGNPRSPRLQGGINVLGARVGTLSVAPATLDLTPLPLGYKVDTAFGFAELAGAERRESCARKEGEPAGSLRLSGFLPLDDSFALDRPGLALELSGAGVPLAAIEAFVPSVTETAGCFAIGGQVGGTLKDPSVAVGIALQHGSATVVPLGVRLEDMDLDGRFQEGRLVVDQFSLRTNSGRPRLDGATSGLHGSGSVTLDGIVPAAVEGRVTLEHAWLIARADRAVQVSGELEVSGKDRALDVAGRLEVDEGFLNFPSRFFAADGEGGLHPDIHILRGGAEQAVEAPEAAMAPAFTVRPKVHVNLARHMRISASLPLQGAYGDLARSLSTVRVDAELDGEVDLTHKGGVLRLTGELETTRGTADILGRPFDLTGGTIAFTGADLARPILDLTADYSVNCDGEASLVRVAISGVPGAPELAFSGEGELTDQDAILRALVLGSCPGDADADAASQDALLGLVAGMLADDLASTGQTLFQLESLELDTTGSTRVSVALGRNLFLTTAYDPLADPTTENSFSVQVELALPYRWYLSVETGDHGVTAISSYRKFRF